MGNTFSNIAALRLRSGVDDAHVVLLGYYSEGDGGGGLFSYSSSSTDDDNNGTIIKPTNVSGAGRWLRLLPDVRIYNVKWFGATGDGSTDDSAAFSACLAALPRLQIAFNQYSKGTLLIPQPDVSYFLTEGILVEDHINIIGTTTAAYPFSACTLSFPQDSFGINLLMGNPSGGSRGCYVQNLYLLSRGTSTDKTKNGLEYNATTYVMGVYADGFGGRGIYENTTVNGNANVSRIDNSGGANNQMGGIYIDGGESSATTIVNPNCQFNGGCNIRDNGFLGVNIVGGHTSGSGLRIGIISSNWASHDGHFFICKRDHTNKEPGVAVDWADYWQQLESVEIPDSVAAWSSSTSYELSANLARTGISQAGMDIGLYCESGSGDNINTSTGSVSVGGTGNSWFARNAGFMRYNNGYLDAAGKGFSCINDFSEKEVYTRMSIDGVGAVSELSGNAGAINFRAFSGTSTVGFFANSLTNYPSLYWNYKQLSGFGSGRSTLFEGTPIVGRKGLLFQDVSVNDIATANKRMLSFSSAPPVNDSTVYAKGDIVFNDMTVTDDATVLGWKCTVSGTPGTWVILHVTTS